MLIVEHPRGRERERRYVADVVLGEHLGVAHECVATERSDVRLTLRGDDACELRLPDVLFAHPEHAWLTRAMLPTLPLARAALPIDWPLPDDHAVPVLFGDRSTSTAEEPVLGIDVFGSAFFLLTRAEERIDSTRDEHDRFAASSSLAVAAGFLDRPLVDEYVELLGRAISRRWPGLRGRTPPYRVVLTHDVDWPLCNLRVPLRAAVRSAVGDVVRRRDPVLAARRLRSWLHHRRGRFDTDPFDTFDGIMSTSERHGLRSAFYFIADHSHPSLDGTYRLEDPWIQRLIGRVAERGHEVGLHASYQTFRDEAQTRREIDRLRRTAESVGLRQERWGGRQHFLRWSNPETWRNWAAAGLSYDATLGFADRAGFRCGTSREYPVFDLSTRERLSLRERPLIVMEGSLFAYERLGFDAGLARAEQLASRVRRLGGDFSLLWHNSSLGSRNEKRAYERFVKALT